MANTPNYNLKKVEYTEIADIPGHFNANFDTVDTAMKSNADAAVAAEDNAKSFASGLIGTLSNLLTVAKNNIVAAVNEIFGKVEDVEDDLAAHKAENVTKVVLITEPFDQITNTTINLGFQPKSVHVESMVELTEYSSVGFADDDNQYTKYWGLAAGRWEVSSGAIYFRYDSLNYILGFISITSTGIIITWEKVGTLPNVSGNRRMIIYAVTHGGV